MKNKVYEVLKFGINGGICFVIEYILLLLFTETFNIHYLISSGIAFILSTAVNYVICIKWVFDVEKRLGTKETGLFWATSILGLGFNQLLMWCLVSLINVDYRISKIFTAGIIMIINYFVKKIILVDSK